MNGRPKRDCPNRKKTLVRKFDLQISSNLIYCRKWALEVIGGIENDRLLTLDENEEFSLRTSEDGSLQIDSCFKYPVSIKEWLPIACQSIRSQAGPQDDFDNPSGIACYKSFAGEVLFPCGGGFIPAGPVAFNGAIIFSTDFVNSVSEEGPDVEAKFKCVMAHELVHVFDIMKFLVPAFRNWENFWKVCLGDGTACDEIERLLMFNSVFIDDYGTDNESVMIAEYWPTSARKWFDAFRK